MANISHVETLLARAIRCGYNLKIVSEPARGKTREIHRLAEKWMQEGFINFFSVLNGPSVSPLDLTATMPDMEKGILKRFHDGSLPNHYKTPDAVGFIYMGEGELMDMVAQRPWQKIVNHEDFGDHLHPIRLPDKVSICTDGNLMTDKTGVQAQMRALGRRYDYIRLSYDPQPYVEFALGHFHSKVGSFLKRYPQCVDNYSEVFDPKRTDGDVMKIEGKNGIWANMGSWERLSNKLHDLDKTGIDLLPEELECVGTGMAKTFTEHLLILDNLATLEQIAAQPKKAKVPDQMDGQYALTYMLALSVEHTRFPAVATYMHRLPPEMQTAFLLTMNERFNEQQKKAVKGVKIPEAALIRDSQEYINWSAEPAISALMLNQLV